MPFVFPCIKLQKDNVLNVTPKFVKDGFYSWVGQSS